MSSRDFASLVALSATNDAHSGATRIRIVAIALAVLIVSAGCGKTARVMPEPEPSGSLYSCPAGKPHCIGAVPAALRRALHVPVLAPGATCPVTVGGNAGAPFGGSTLGPGPVYAIIVEDRGGEGIALYDDPPTGELEGSRWGGVKVLWTSRPSYQGPVLIRVRSLDGSPPAGFEVGDPPVAELQFAPGESLNVEQGWRDWPTAARFRKPGCYAWQVDGESFSEVVVVQAIAHRRG